jgi:O-antigen/teichoic acid export membrane protein
MTAASSFELIKRLVCGAPAAPGGPATEAERGSLRNRRVHLTAAASLGFRGVILLSGFLYIPLTVRYLGPARYGLWVAITSIVTLLAFADCGIGFGLMNDVAYSIGRGGDGDCRKSISSTFYVLVAIALVGCLAFLLASPFVSWQDVFRTRTLVEAVEARRAVGAVVVGFLLTLPFTTVQRVQYARQVGYHSQLWEAAGAVFGLFGILIAIRLHAGLPVLAIVFCAGPFLALVLNWLVYFLMLHPHQFPDVRLIDFGVARKIVRDGWYFSILQISGVLVFSIDSFVVLHYFGQAASGQYNLVARLFLVLPALAGVWLAPLWPAYADSIARGDREWVRSTLLRSTLIATMGCAAVSCALALVARPLIRLWTGAEIHPSVWLLSGFALYSTLLCGAGSIAAYLNGSNFIKRQAVLVASHAVLSVALKIGLSKYWDISGAVWGTNVSFLLVVIPAYYVIVPGLIRKQKAVAAGCPDVE